jgi:hypothetical protein
VQAPGPHPAHETQRDPFGHCESLVHQQGTPAALHDPVEEVTSSQLPSEQDHAFATDAVVWQTVPEHVVPHFERRFPDAESLATALRDLLPVRADAGDPSSDDKTIVSFEAPAEDLESSAEVATKMMPSAAESASVTEPLASVAEAPRSAGVVATLPSQSVTQAPTTELIEPIPTLPFGSPTAMPKPRAAPEVLKQSAVSWGRSQRLTRRPSRILWVLASAVGLGAATTAVVVVSRSGGGAPVASSPTGTPLDTRLEAPVLRVETAPGKSESNQPSTVSVLDLPRVTPEPVAAASVATVRKVGVPPVRASGGEANVDAGRTVLANHAATAQVAAPRASAEKLDPLAP